jgi:hypothetical protein
MKINKNEKERRIEGRDYGGVHPSATERIATGVQPNANELPRPFYISLSLSLFLF